MAAHVLNLKLQLGLRSVLGTLYSWSAMCLQQSHASPDLECKVLEEMCGAIGSIRFCSTSGINPYPDRRRLRPW